MIDFSVFDYGYDEYRKMSIYKCVTVYICIIIFMFQTLEKISEKKHRKHVKKINTQKNKIYHIVYKYKINKHFEEFVKNVH